MISFERVGRQSDAVLRNLYQLYIHDMSEWLGIEIASDGRFVFDTAALWEDDVAVHLARFGGALAGFAVVQSAGPWLGRKKARDVKDLFVLRHHRRHGVGRALARHLFETTATEWLVRVVAANAPAVPFWRGVIRELRGDRYEESTASSGGRDWLRLRFDGAR
ncbi:MAG TPA: GNAT family N-acetyltransferase [Polyangia bacterium]|nr:GNAT family N-acetyltransferase [Polyangia bacterium]